MLYIGCFIFKYSDGSQIVVWQDITIDQFHRFVCLKV
jgi:hypothetical protein